MTEISDDLSKLLFVLEDGWCGHEGKRYCNFSIGGVGSYVDVAIGSLIVAKGEPGELDSLVLPLSVDDVLLVEQSAGDFDETDFEVAFELADSGVHRV